MPTMHSNFHFLYIPIEVKFEMVQADNVLWTTKIVSPK